MTNTQVDTPTHEVNAHVRFAAEQFGFKVEWVQTEWRVRSQYRTNYGCSFSWAESEGVEAFFKKVFEHFYESGRESVECPYGY